MDNPELSEICESCDSCTIFIQKVDDSKEAEPAFLSHGPKKVLIFEVKMVLKSPGMGRVLRPGNPA